MLCSRTAGDLLDIKSQMSTEGIYWSLICVRFRVLGYPVACARAPLRAPIWGGLILSLGATLDMPGAGPGKVANRPRAR